MKTMTKKSVLKLAMTLVAAFVFTSAYSQGNEGDYGVISADAIAAGVSYVTQDATIPLYVLPDPVYHPTWAFPSTNITADFTWVFTPDGWALGTQLSFVQPGDLNYVEITGIVVGGPYETNVRELAPAAYGGCSDSGRDFAIVVTGKPTAEFEGTDTPANDWDELVAGYSYRACGSKAAENINITITEQNAPAALQLYAYSVSKRVVILDVNGLEEDVVSTDDIIDHTIAGKGLTSSVSTGALDVLNYDWGTGTAVPSRTLYEFTLAPATDAPVGINGIISAISHKSDYLALSGDADAFTDYAFTGTTVISYVVNPTPVTGPIYHIPNDFGL
jgi:hypothetical protein